MRTSSTTPTQTRIPDEPERGYPPTYTPFTLVSIPIGIIPDTSSSEFAHQQSKLVGRSSGSDVAAHFARRANTNAATLALANNLEYDVSMYDRRRKEHLRVQVRPGPGCVDAMKQLGHALRLGFSGAPRDDYAAPTPTPAQLKGQYPGGATWTATLWQEGDEDAVEGDWVDRLKSGNLRPDALALLKGYRTYYGCDGRGAGVPCDNCRCPWCSVNPNALENVDIACSRYYHAAPYVASSGQGRWKGGDAKSASRPGPPLDWALGAGGGDDVEIWKAPPPDADEHAQIDPSKLTIAKIIYFFKHESNAGVDGGGRADTWWVLVHDYVGIGQGTSNVRVIDPITQHPVLRLRGRGRPLVYPADAIRRQLHLYHRCPEAGEWRCGEVPAGPVSAAASVWQHKYKLLSPDAGDGYDQYLLNEFHHTASRDSFVD